MPTPDYTRFNNSITATSTSGLVTTLTFANPHTFPASTAFVQIYGATGTLGPIDGYFTMTIVDSQHGTITTGTPAATASGLTGITASFWISQTVSVTRTDFFTTGLSLDFGMFTKNLETSTGGPSAVPGSGISVVDLTHIIAYFTQSHSSGDWVTRQSPCGIYANCPGINSIKKMTIVPGLSLPRWMRHLRGGKTHDARHPSGGGHSWSLCHRKMRYLEY